MHASAKFKGRAQFCQPCSVYALTLCPNWFIIIINVTGHIINPRGIHRVTIFVKKMIVLFWPTEHNWNGISTKITKVSTALLSFRLQGLTH